jgi:hypothetical protein
MHARHKFITAATVAVLLMAATAHAETASVRPATERIYLQLSGMG